MCVQKPIKENIIEDYENGDYFIQESNREELYQQYLDNNNTVLPYFYGVWVTAYAFRNLFELGKCVDRTPDEFGNVGQWVYSDTDSCYATRWNEEKLAEYNEGCKKKLLANGYGAVIHNNREYWLGVAEFDGAYSEFKVQGAKRYCGRNTEDNELHITVAGVPKKGAKCLHNNIDNFTKGMIFAGTETGKLTHTYIYVDDIYIDKNGNEVGDSVDLSPCDYLLDSVYTVDWESLLTEEIEVQVYE